MSRGSCRRAGGAQHSQHGGRGAERLLGGGHRSADLVLSNAQHLPSITRSNVLQALSGPPAAPHIAHNSCYRLGPSVQPPVCQAAVCWWPCRIAWRSLSLWAWLTSRKWSGR